MILVLDTSREPVCIGVAEDGAVKAERVIDDRRQLSDQLLAEIDAVLVKAKLTPANLEGIGVVTGPGSFTGLRIGLAVANALAMAEDLPVVGVPGPEADSLSQLAATAAVELKAGRGERQVYPEYGKPPTITPPKR